MLKHYKILSQLNYIMSSYNPPIENVPIFDSSLFRDNNAETSLTITQADKRYLRYPVAQGNETLQGATIQGALIANSSSTLNGVVNANNDLIVKNQITLQDTTSPNTFYTDIIAQPNGTLNVNTNGNGVPTNPSIAFAINNINWFALNSATGFINFNAPSMNINTTNPPVCSATQPAFTDSSTKIPTTAWVQGAINSNNSTLAYYRTGLIAGNQKPLTTPLVISVNTGSQTGSGITMCPLVFRMTCSYTNGLTPANQQDSNGVSTFCNTCSCIFNYFVYNSQPVVSGTNVNYFNNAMGGNATQNTAYYNNVVYGNNYGRPFWTTNLSNEANVSTIFPFTFTGTPFLNGVKTIQFDPPAVGYPATSSFYWEWTIEVLNKANFAGMITSTGFSINLNC